MNSFILLALLAMVGYGLTAALYKAAAPHIDAISLTLLSSIVMTTTVFVLWWLKSEKHFTTAGLGYAGMTGIVSGLAFAAFIKSIHLGSSSVATTIRGLSFLVTTAVALLWLGENITTAKLVAILLSAIALVLLVR